MSAKPLRKVVKWSAILLLTAVLAAAGVLYLLACSVPVNYRPAPLSAQQRRQTAPQFVNHLLLFGKDAENVVPYTWSATEEQLNWYLASMDEVAALPPGREPGQVDKMMKDAGIADPAVALGDGVLTVMVRSTEYGKVLAADVSFVFQPEHNVSVRLGAVRVGRLPVPKAHLRGVLQQIKDKLTAAMSRPMRNGKAGGGSFETVAADRVPKLLARVVAAIDAEPISAELVWPIGDRRVRIDGIDIADHRLTLRATPIGRDRAAK